MNTEQVLSELRARILTHSTVQMMAAGVFPLNVPQDANPPAITYQLVNTARQPTLSGVDPLPQMRVQIDAWGKRAETAAELADAVRSCLDCQSWVAGGVRFAGAFAANEWQGQDIDAKAFRHSQDFFVWSGEP